MPPRCRDRQSKQPAESPPPQPATAPPPAPVDPMGVFYGTFQAMPNFPRYPIRDRQSQLAAFVKVGPPEFDGFQGPFAADRWIKAIQNTVFLLGTPNELQVPFFVHRLTAGALT